MTKFRDTPSIQYQYTTSLQSLISCRSESSLLLCTIHEGSTTERAASRISYDFLSSWGGEGENFVGTDAENALEILERKPLLTLNLNFLLKSLGLPEHQGLSKNWVSGIPKFQGLSSLSPFTGHFMGGIPHIPTYSHISHSHQSPGCDAPCLYGNVTLSCQARAPKKPGTAGIGTCGTCVALAGSDWLPPPCRIQEEV